MDRNRWGGTGPTSGGRIRRGAARARDWADDKTGRKASAGWRAARGQRGFNNRRRAAGQAVRNAGGGGLIAGIVGIIAAMFAGVAALAGGARARADKHMDGVDPTVETKHQEPNAPQDDPVDVPSWMKSEPTPQPEPANDLPDNPEKEPATTEHTPSAAGP